MRGKQFMIIAKHKEMPVLILIIFQINSFTLSVLPWPIMLLTIADVVAAKAQMTHPTNPNTFRITLETANAVCPWCSTRMKKYTQLMRLMASWKINGNEIDMMSRAFVLSQRKCLNNENCWLIPL